MDWCFTGLSQNISCCKYFERWGVEKKTNAKSGLQWKVICREAILCRSLLLNRYCPAGPATIHRPYNILLSVQYSKSRYQHTAESTSSHLCFSLYQQRAEMDKMRVNWLGKQGGFKRSQKFQSGTGFFLLFFSLCLWCTVTLYPTLAKVFMKL